MRLIERLADYTEGRLGLRTAWRSFTDRKLPAGIGWLHTFGSASVFLLAVQIVTGVFLAFYYVPSPEHAYDSVSQLSHDLAFGAMVRGIHKWGASLTVILVALHLLRVLFAGAYKYPRELTWVVGVLLLLVVLAFGFTGYLLPWDQKGYWATVVGTHIAGTAPLVGHFLLEVLRGQPEVGVRTLGRFYAFHTLFLPGFLVGLVAIHLAMVIRQGIAAPPRGEYEAVPPDEYASVYARFKQRGRPFYESMAKDAIVALLLLLTLLGLSWRLGAPLGPQADPASTTFVPRPEWYFFFLFELLWWFPGRWIQVATFWIPLGLIALLLLLPWLDRGPHRAARRRPWVTVPATAALLLAVLLTYKGATAPIPAAAASGESPAGAVEPTPLVARGRRVYEEQGCSMCHVIGGKGSTAGPDLTEVGRRRDAAWMRKYIVNPESLNPDAEMIEYDDLSPDELEALVAYLETI